MIKVGVVGGTGYTGVELLRLLALHPDVQLEVITSRGEAGTRVADLFPNLRGYVDLEFREPDLEALASCELVFFATPNGIAMSMAQQLLDNRDLLEIADWHDLPNWYTKDLVTAKRQFLSVLDLMADRPAVNAALGYLLDNFDSIPRVGNHNRALTRHDVECHIATLAGGTDEQKAIAALPSTAACVPLP